MQLPPELGWMDAAYLASIALFLVAWVQYWKAILPEEPWVIRGFSLGSSIGFAYLISPAMGKPMTILEIVLYGIAAAIFGNLTYQFLSSKRSPTFSLPSQEHLKK